MMITNGEIVTCSRALTPELFKATCGGQGLTGVILTARIFLKKIKSQNIDQTTIKTSNLKETFEAFEDYKNCAYSVAWLDCLAKGNKTGRSLIKVGDFMDDGDLSYQQRPKLNISFSLPGFLLNQWTVRAFNQIYYARVKKKVSHQKVGIDAFFYPLDSIRHWNRIYGKNGFTQYQFILPKEHSYKGLQEVLDTIADSGKGSFLAVLKLHGNANENYLSFPMEGYSLALDFKLEKGLFKLLDKLDCIVVKYGGRIYLAKDARVTKHIFEQGYPQIDTFRQIRQDKGMDRVFQSLQSKRVGI
jgi:FAD/FMN-containing dehydrogenase